MFEQTAEKEEPAIERITRESIKEIKSNMR